MFSQGAVVAIVGPTGIGKTKLSVTLALALGGEVVSVDSLQVYRDGHILTAQATPSEMKGIRHHMIDYLEAFEEPNGFLEEALSAIRGIHSRGKVAVLCGGSTSLTEPLLFHPAVKRSNPLIITLFTDMNTLGTLTDRRIDSMIGDGLLEEIRDLGRLHDLHVSDGKTSVGIWKAIGFPELAPSFGCPSDVENSIQLEVGVAKMKHETRVYADKQLKWIWGSFLHKAYQQGFNTLLFRVEGKQTFRRDVEEKALELVPQWLNPAARHERKTESVRDDVHWGLSGNNVPTVNPV